jgi:hypothetical protein
MFHPRKLTGDAQCTVPIRHEWRATGCRPARIVRVDRRVAPCRSRAKNASQRFARRNRQNVSEKSPFFHTAPRTSGMRRRAGLPQVAARRHGEKRQNVREKSRFCGFVARQLLPCRQPSGNGTAEVRGLGQQTTAKILGRNALPNENRRANLLPARDCAQVRKIGA